MLNLTCLFDIEDTNKFTKTNFFFSETIFFYCFTWYSLFYLYIIVARFWVLFYLEMLQNQFNTICLTHNSRFIFVLGCR